MRLLRSLLLLLAGACALTACGGDDEEMRRPPAPTAAAFLDSIGVNVHMSYGDTPYANVDLVRQRLRELRVRHVRDGVLPGRPDHYAALNALAEDGVRSQLIVGDPAGRFGTGTLEEQLAVVKQELLHTASAIEGPNEYDVSGDPDWAARLRDYQARLADAVEGEPALSELPVVGPSVALGDSRRRLGDLSEDMDLGNMHPYPGGEPPEANLAHELRLAGLVSGRRPVVASETGYHDAAASQNPHSAVSEDAAAAYLPRLFLTYFRAGVRRTYAYELLDERPDPGGQDLEANFGLLREDFSPKPAFVALRNLIAAVGPTSGLTGDSAPAYALMGNTNEVQQLLLDRGGGAFALVLWSTARVWGTDSRTDLDPGVRRLTVELSEPVASARVVRLGQSSAPERRLVRSASIPVDVPADPVVVQLER